MKAKNLMYITQLLYMSSAFIKTLSGGGAQSKAPPPSSSSSSTTARPPLPPQGEGEEEEGAGETKLLRLNDFLFASGLDNLNLFKVRVETGLLVVS